MKKLSVFYHININNNSAGGIINFLRGLIIELDKKMDLTYYTMNYQSDSYENSHGVKEVFLKTMKKNPNIKGRIPNNLIYLLNVTKFLLLKRFTSEDILLFNRIDHTLPAILFQRRPRKILIIHGSSKFDKAHFGKSYIRIWFNKLSEKLAIKYFDEIILVSQDGYEYYVKEYPSHKDKFQFIPTYVNREVFKKEVLTVSPTDEDEKLTYIYFGRFVRQKGCVFMKEYFDFLDSKEVDYRALMIGEGELGYMFENSQRVKVIKTLTQKDLVKYLNKKNILIMFSRWEGMPLTLLEALSTGTPAITSNAGEMKYIMKNAYNGFHFEDIENSYEEILKSSLEIYSNYDFYSNNSQESIKNYSIENVVDRYYELLSKGCD